MPSVKQPEDEFWKRAGIANALQSCIEIMDSEYLVMGLFNFLINDCALGDPNVTVQQMMLKAGFSCLNSRNGKAHTFKLLALFDTFLGLPAKANEDIIRESVVILLGTLACHLEPKDPRISKIVEKLMETLATPSERVQIAVSECLSPLIKMNKETQSKWISLAMHSLLNSEKYGDRRGFAYGLAGIVKGCGFSSLRQYSIINRLKDAAEDKKNLNGREAALFAFETLSFTLGRLFEPYVTEILPILLVSFGDGNSAIREATQYASKMIMSKVYIL